MADGTNQRYRSNDPYARGAPGGGAYQQHGHGPAPAPAQAGGDPLAELARLIGQNDPFSDYGRDGARAPVPRDPRRAEMRVAEWRNGAPAPDAYQVPIDPRATGNGGYPPQDPYGAAQGGHYPAGPQQNFDNDPYGGNGYADPAYQDDGAPAYPPGYDPYGQGQGAPNGRGYDAAYYRDDPRSFQHGEDMYEDVRPARRRGGMMTVLAVVGLAVVGTAAAFGYRAVFGTSGGAKTPPVIRADATPNKVVPASEGRDPQSGKQIYDRVGDRSQGEKVVSREEQPVDMKTPPRVVLPGPNADSAAAPAIPSSATALAPIASGATGEPKRIRTVTIRPDQPTAADIPTARAVPAARSSTQAVAASPAEPPAAVAHAPARPAAAPQAHAQAQAAAQPQGADDGPLSLTPPMMTRATPARSTGTAMRTASAPAAVAGGSYTVQVSSQRSEADAQSTYRGLQAKFPNILGGREPIIRRADLGDKGIYYRVQVGPFGTVEQASELCNGLKAAGGQCIVQRN
jgi:hypothetical protein